MALPRTIAVAVDKVARQTIGKDWGLYAALLNHWPDIVGQEYAKVCSPVKISFPKGKAEGHRTDGLLHIRLPQGLAMEFSFLTDQIRQRISACFGYQAIERVVFETYYAQDNVILNDKVSDAPVELPENVNSVEDDELRQALEAFGKAVLRAEKRG